MGRLENIIERHERRKWPRERVLVMLLCGTIMLVLLVLTVFTDLALPPAAPGTEPAGRAGPGRSGEPAGAGEAPGSAGSAVGAGSAGPRRATRVDGVLLGAPATGSGHR
jgi:hypothetical protein